MTYSISQQQRQKYNGPNVAHKTPRSGILCWRKRCKKPSQSFYPLFERFTQWYNASRGVAFSEYTNNRKAVPIAFECTFASVRRKRKIRRWTRRFRSRNVALPVPRIREPGQSITTIPIKIILISLNNGTPETHPRDIFVLYLQLFLHKLQIRTPTQSTSTLKTSAR